MAEQAQAQDAQLVLFPEFMPQGYLLTPALWDAAERFDGPTTRWLAETARRMTFSSLRRQKAAAVARTRRSPA